MKTISDLCKPQDDIPKAESGRTDYAANPVQVIRNSGSDEYRKPELFFPNAITIYPFVHGPGNEDDGPLDRTAGIRDHLAKAIYARQTTRRRLLSGNTRIETRGS